MPEAILAAERGIDVAQGSRRIGRLVVLAVAEGANEALGKGATGLRAALILAASLALMSADAVICPWRDLRARTREARCPQA